MKQKIVLGLVLLLGLSQYTWSQQKDDVDSMTSEIDLNALYSRKAKNAKKIRNTGLYTTAGGTAIFIAGYFINQNSTSSNNFILPSIKKGPGPSPSKDEYDEVMVFGGAAIITGITLATLGHLKYKKYNNKNLSFNISPNSVYLSYSF